MSKDLSNTGDTKRRTSTDAPTSRRPYVAPKLRSTDAFERLALFSCPGASETEGDCDEL